MARSALARLLVLGAVLLAALAPALPARAAPGERCFAETNQCVAGRFLAYWDANGGLARNGYPLTPERREVLEDGKAYTVQYFERVRMEYHPENVASYDVLLGQFGRRVLREAYQIGRRAYPGAVAPVAPLMGAIFFPETGHNLGGAFRNYWQANGALAQFGYPLTEERFDTLEDGVLHRTQYFERGRLEEHREYVGSPYAIQLGQFGRQILGENALLGGDLGSFFLGSERVQVQLGAPVTSAVIGSGATLPFEGGRMFYAAQAPSQEGIRGGHVCFPDVCAGLRVTGTALATPTLAFSSAPGDAGPTIYVLCDGADTGQTDRSFPSDPGPSGRTGVAGPRPGTYEPAGAFGTLWRERRLAEGRCTNYEDTPLGYATAPVETPLTIAVQYFAGGAILVSDTPARRDLYGIWVGYFSLSGSPGGYYERYALPK